MIEIPYWTLGDEGRYLNPDIRLINPNYIRLISFIEEWGEDWVHVYYEFSPGSLTKYTLKPDYSKTKEFLQKVRA